MFILPTLALNLQCLVVSPLIALQEDQVSKLLSRNVVAVAMNSVKGKSYTDDDIKKYWMTGDIQFLYISPEKLQNKDVQSMLQYRRPGLVVVDEVHSADAWGEDFRPAYSRLVNLIDSIRPVKLLCLTATLTPDAELNVIRMLGMKKVRKLVSFSCRENLKFKTSPGLDMNGIAKVLSKSGGPTIIYSSTVKTIEDILLPALAPTLADCGGVVAYHGQMTHATRTQSQDLFMSGRVRNIIATNAFGMGVDKADVRMVAHIDIPGSVEAYVQESGRAGRDGKDSTCFLTFSAKSISTQQHFLDMANPPRKFYELFWEHLTRWAEVSKDYDEQYRGPGILGKVIKLTVNEMSFQVQSQAVTAALSQLSHMRFILRGGMERSTICGEVMDVTKMPKGDAKDCEKDKAILKHFIQVGPHKKIPVTDVANELGFRTIKSFEGRLSSLSDAGALCYRIGSRSKTTTVIKNDLSTMDWDHLERKRERELKALSQMVEFAEIPDADKHTALKNYFETGELHA